MIPIHFFSIERVCVHSDILQSVFCTGEMYHKSLLSPVCINRRDAYASVWFMKLVRDHPTRQHVVWETIMQEDGM